MRTTWPQSANNRFCQTRTINVNLFNFYAWNYEGDMWDYYCVCLYINLINIVFRYCAKMCVAKKRIWEHSAPFLGQWSADFLINIAMEEKVWQVEKVEREILWQCSLICVFMYNVHIGHVYTKFFYSLQLWQQE